VALTDALDAVTAETISSAPDTTLTIPAVTTLVSEELTDEQVTHAQERAEKIIGEQLVFEHDRSRRTLSDTDLIPLLTLPDGYQLDPVDDTLKAWARDLNRTPQNAEFVYNPDTLTVTTFIPDRAGQMLDVSAVKQRIEEGLRELEGTDTANLTDSAVTKTLVVIETPADVTLAETNDLGINERIGFGESYYAHSIPSRIHNVALTAARINFTIVKPGEEFSFNKALGDVSSATGFQPAYVIKDGATVLGDGGGVCQVSSTLFRALLDSGLKITRRLPHSYRVSYYELDRKPGFDATVYAGEVDLRFVNDTDHAVLVYTHTDSDNLYMFIELYGTSDGRTTGIVDYQSWDARPALPTVYVPDPTLAPGQLKQIDWSAPGIKAQFTHIIRDKDGNLMSEKEYYSNYRPWAAKFLQGI
jgi:vancomycin resistance protein YoaR